MRLPGPVRLFHRPAPLALGLALIVVAGVFLLVLGSPRNRIYRPPEDDIAIPRDPASIARGRHLVEAVAVCTICHGENLGGKLAFEDTFLGRGYTANLTSGRGASAGLIPLPTGSAASATGCVPTGAA